MVDKDETANVDDSGDIVAAIKARIMADPAARAGYLAGEILRQIGAALKQMRETSFPSWDEAVANIGDIASEEDLMRIEEGYAPLDFTILKMVELADFYGFKLSVGLTFKKCEQPPP